MALIFAHTPGEWDGTYTIAARALLTDLLADGEPVEIAINNEVRLRTLVGYDRETDCAVFAGNETVDMFEIDEIRAA